MSNIALEILSIYESSHSDKRPRAAMEAIINKQQDAYDKCVEIRGMQPNYIKYAVFGLYQGDDLGMINLNNALLAAKESQK